MAKIVRKKRRGSGGAGILALLIALAVGAGYFFRDCMPNFGTGGGKGSGVEKASPEEPKKEQPEPVGAQGTIAVTVKGEECATGNQPAAPCAAVCAELGGGTPKDARIAVDATVGAHQVVEDFKKCLTDAGFTDVTVKAE